MFCFSVSSQVTDSDESETEKDSRVDKDRRECHDAGSSRDPGQALPEVDTTCQVNLFRS